MNEPSFTRLFDLLDKYRPGGEFHQQQDVLSGKVKGDWIIYSGKDYVESADALSAIFLEMGIQKGDNIATILKNSPEFNFIDMALMQIGAVQVPIYPTISAENFKYIFLDAEVKYVFVSNKDIYQRVASVVADVPSVREVFSVDPIEGLKTVKELIGMGIRRPRPEEMKTISDKITEQDLATIIYTSGTTGNPKGVMITHRNFVFNVKGVSDILPKNLVTRAVSFLPLCHIYERMLNYMYQNLGISIYYSETESLAQNLKETQPEIFCAVPRVIEKFYDKIINKGRNLKYLQKQVFFWAVNLGYHYQLYGHNSFWFRIRHKIADILVFSKWREGLGGNIKIIVSGGATLQPRLAHVFWAAGIQMIEGYGLTETSPVIAVNTFVVEGARIGTVGPVMTGVEVKFADDGEILARGPGVMTGYFKQPETTREVIDPEGWFHTGDIGLLEDGIFLKITDRKKEIFKTSGGKFIAPQTLENKFKESPFIENVIIIGENQAFPSALIIPGFEHIRNWAKVKGISIHTNTEIASNPLVYKRIMQEINDINKTLDKTEQVKKVKILDHEWTVDSGDL
ncbi:MAG: long-chain fatty acid--CoA ligase, partial [Bacteroidetes bacterium]|nr:long-chain fatty acid--CoA ligase [Bacteroidota bacterium]